MEISYETLRSWAQTLLGRTALRPQIALVLGSGLGRFAERVTVEAEVPYRDLPGFPVSTVAGHEGKFLFGRAEGVPVVLLQGRVHYYEGYTMAQVAAPARVLGLMGVQTLLLTNAAGGINLDFTPGDLMLITDHISAFVPSPLRGQNADALGPRFPDMSRVYDPALLHAADAAAERLGIPLKRGVYLQWQGPNYETPAEIRMFRTLGADAVGMSTACEAIAARHMGMRVCGVSCITNMASGILSQPLDHAEVQQVADRVHEKFEDLMLSLIADIGK